MSRPLSWYKNLTTAKGRAESGAFLVEGPRAVAQIALCAGSGLLEVVTDGSAEAPAGVSHLVRTLAPRQFATIAPSRTPQGILAVVRIPADSASPRLPQNPGGDVLLLEDVQDPGNVGTLIRDAAAFGFAGVILSSGCADPFSPKCVQASAGTLLSIWIRRSNSYLDLAASLQKRGARLAAAALDGADDNSWATKLPTVLALGNEGQGLSERLLSLADMRFQIPIDRSRAESLNVAAAGAIAMYLLAQRR